jgi:5-methylcytosine-specific restriction endonuclease McrA
MTIIAERRAMKRELVAEISQQLVNRRSASIFKHQCEKAEKLQIARPDYTLDQLRAFVTDALASERATCPYCTRKLTPKNFELDHATPLNRGGQFTVPNTDVICGPCNKKKGGLTRQEFSSLLEFVSTLASEARADILQRLGIGGRWKR